jgi:hypothetical protein
LPLQTNKHLSVAGVIVLGFLGWGRLRRLGNGSQDGGGRAGRHSTVYNLPSFGFEVDIVKVRDGLPIILFE